MEVRCERLVVDRQARQALAPLTVDVHVDPVLALALAQVLVVVRRQVLHPVGLIGETTRLDGHVHLLRVCAGEVLLPVCVEVRRVGRAPDFLHLLAVVIHAPLHRVALVIHSPLRTVRHHHPVGIPAKSARERVEHIRVDLAYLIHHGKGQLQRQKPPHVVGIIEPAKKDVHFDIIKAHYVA